MKRTQDSSLSLSKRTKTTEGALVRQIKRTSALSAPIMQLTGHEAEVYSVRFSPDGTHLASSSFDRHIFLWNTYGDCKNYSLLKGHAGAVLETCWSRDNVTVFSCSADKTLGIWNSETSQRSRKLRGHASFVNSLAVCKRGSEMLASVSDDCMIKVWDIREKNAVLSFQEEYPMTAVEWNADATIVYSGGIDNTIKAWDIRKGEIVYTLGGHTDTITGLELSPDGTSLLSNSMDNTLGVWDIKPFAVSGDRLIRKLTGAAHGFEKNLLRACWSPDGDFVAAGSGDRSVVVWYRDRIVYKLPGHKGCVNQVSWHPKEPVIASCSNDKTIFLGELDPEEVK